MADDTPDPDSLPATAGSLGLCGPEALDRARALRGLPPHERSTPPLVALEERLTRRPTRDEGDELLPEAFRGVFDFHPAGEVRQRLHEHVRARCRSLAVDLAAVCPPSAETTLALRAVQTAMHQANAALAVHGPAEVDSRG